MKLNLSKVVEMTSYTALCASLVALSISVTMVPSHADDQVVVPENAEKRRHLTLKALLNANLRMQNMQIRIDALEKKSDNTAEGLGKVAKRVSFLESVQKPVSEPLK